MSWNMENIFMGSINRGAKAVVMWNIALDENNGPKNGGCQNCRGVLTIDSETSNVVKNEEYFSKFVEALRIQPKSTIFLNPDGSIVVVVHNKSSNTISFNLDLNSSQMTYQLSLKTTNIYTNF